MLLTIYTNKIYIKDVMNYGLFIFIIVKREIKMVNVRQRRMIILKVNRKSYLIDMEEHGHIYYFEISLLVQVKLRFLKEKRFIL